MGSGPVIERAKVAIGYNVCYERNGAGFPYFEGAAGSPNYSVQRRTSKGWRTVCRHCVTDAVGHWRWRVPGGCFRIRGFTLGGQPGPEATWSDDLADVTKA